MFHRPYRGTKSRVPWRSRGRHPITRTDTLERAAGMGIRGGWGRRYGERTGGRRHERRTGRCGEARMTTSASRRRILLAEDETIVAMMVEEMLAELGYDVAETVAQIDTARRAAEKGAF